MLLSPERKLRCSTFKPSQLPVSPVLIAPGEDLLETGRSLLNALPKRILGIQLMQCDERLIAMPKAVSDAEVSIYMETGSTFIGSNFSEYHSRLPPQARKNLERRIRKAEKEIGEVTLQVWNTIDRIDEFMEIYSRTETEGWKGKAGTAVQLNSPQGHFYRDILIASAKRNDLLMFVLTFGGQPVAERITLCQDGIIYILKTAFNENFGPYSPGSVQRHLLMKWGSQQQPAFRDFEIYGEIKQSTAPFITSQRNLYHLTIFRSRLLRDCLHLYRRIRRISGSFHLDQPSQKPGL